MDTCHQLIKDLITIRNLIFAVDEKLTNTIICQKNKGQKRRCFADLAVETDKAFTGISSYKKDGYTASHSRCTDDVNRPKIVTTGMNGYIPNNGRHSPSKHIRLDAGSLAQRCTGNRLSCPKHEAISEKIDYLTSQLKDTEHQIVQLEVCKDKLARNNDLRYTVDKLMWRVGQHEMLVDDIKTKLDEISKADSVHDTTLCNTDDDINKLLNYIEQHTPKNYTAPRSFHGSPVKVLNGTMPTYCTTCHSQDGE